MQPTGAYICTKYGGFPVFTRKQALTQTFTELSCCEAETDAIGAAGGHTSANAELRVTYDTPCLGSASLTFILDQALLWELTDLVGDPPVPGPVELPIIQFASVTVDWESPDCGTGTSTYQGVYAEYPDRIMSPPIRLGVFTASEFDPILSDGSLRLDDGTLTIPIDAPPGGFSKIDMTSSTELFTEFDGDINGDGWVCGDDRDLMNALVALEPTIGTSGYTVRGDFNLDGVINTADVRLFKAVYAQLPDCNGNGIPDDCDIASGMSDDVNANGIPDECDTGVCCLQRGECAIMVGADCENICGTFHADVTTCRGTPPCYTAQQTWACCVPWGGCESTTECECAGYGGTFYEGVHCEAVSCPDGKKKKETFR